MFGATTKAEGHNEQDLIDAVKKHSVMYDKAHEHYYDTPYKNKTWSEIGLALNRDSQECRTRWKHLRETFLKKYKTLSKDKEALAYQWPYYADMLFLKDYIQFRNKSCCKCRGTKPQYKPARQEPTPQSEVSGEESKQQCKIEFDPDAALSLDAEVANKETCTPPPAKIPKSIEKSLEAIEAAANLIREKVTRKEASGADIDLLLGKTIIGILNEIPACNKDASRQDLFQFVFELKEKYRDGVLFQN